MSQHPVSNRPATSTPRAAWRCILLILLAASTIGLASCGEDNPAQPKTECPTHVDVDGLTIEQNGARLSSQWEGTVLGAIEVGVDATLAPLAIVFLDADSSRVSFAPECTDFSLAFEVSNPTVAICERAPGTPWSVSIRGVSAGETSVRFRVLHGDHFDFSSQLIPIQVGEAGEIAISGLIVQIGGQEVASQREGVVAGEIPLIADSSSTIIEVIWLDEDGAPLPPDDLEEGSSLGWALPSPPQPVEVETIGGQPWRLRLRALELGGTSLELRLLHEGHSDFASAPIPIRISGGPISPPDAVVITRNGSSAATWNFDPVEGPDVSTGPLFAETGASRVPFDVVFLDEERFPVELLPLLHTLEWTVEDSTIATLRPTSGRRWAFDLVGHRPGATTVRLQLRESRALLYESGPIPILIADTPTGDTTPSFVLKENGIWTVIVLEGEVVAEGCDHTADPGRLQVGVGEQTELYSIRLLDAGCEQISLDEGHWRIVMELGDPGVVRVIRHPEHWGEHLNFHLEGLDVGATSVTLHFLEDGVLAFSSPPIPVRVTS